MNFISCIKEFLRFNWRNNNHDRIEEPVVNYSIGNKRFNDENANEGILIKRRKILEKPKDGIIEIDLSKTPVRMKKSTILNMPKHRKQNHPQSRAVSANSEVIEINEDEVDRNEEIVKVDLTNNETCEKKRLKNNSATSSTDIEIVEEYSSDRNVSGVISRPSILSMRLRSKFDPRPLKELGNTHSIASSYISEADRKAASTSSESSQSTTNSFREFSSELSLNKMSALRSRQEFSKLLIQYSKSPSNLSRSATHSTNKSSSSMVKKLPIQKSRPAFESYSMRNRSSMKNEMLPKPNFPKNRKSVADKNVIDLTSEDDEVQRQEIISNVVASDVIRNLKSSFIGKDDKLADEDFISNLLKKYEAQLRVDQNRAEKIRSQIRQKETDFNKTLSEILEQRLSIKDDEKKEEQKPSIEIAPITKTMTAAINQIVSSRKIPLVQVRDVSIKLQDIRTLENSNWLNDEVINAYMNLIKMRAESKPEKYPKVHCFNTFLYEQLQKKGYNSVRRWTKKIDVFDFSVLIVPIHLGNHWCLIQIQIKQKIIRYFDSMGSPNNHCLKIMLQYLVDEFRDKKGGQLDSKEWELINLPPDEIPQQRNMHDCGVFACTFAEHLTRQAPLNFSQDHMQYFRVKMIYEILTGELLL